MFEAEYLKPMWVVSAASFRELHQTFVKLSTWGPHGMTPPVFKVQDIRLGKIFATYGLVCKACYVYHHFCDLRLVPMKRILCLMFDVAMPFLSL